MKRVLKIAGLILAALAVTMLAINMYMGPIVKTAVTKGGPALLGAPIELQDCDFRLLRGHIGLKGLVVRSPAGFKADSVFELGEVVIDFVPLSFFSSAIHIKRVLVKAPHITYEQGLTGTNIGKLLDNASGPEPRKKTDSGSKPAGKSGKKVIIDDILVEGGQVKVAVTALGGYGVPIPLPTLHITDIGRESGGASPVEAVTSIVSAVLKSVISAVGAVGDVAADGVKAASAAVEATGKAAGEAAKDVGAGAKAAIKGIGSLFESGGPNK